MNIRTKHTVITPCKHGVMAYYITDDPIGTCLYCYGEWAEQEFDVISKLINSNSNCIDVGANIGTHSIWFSRQCYNGYVFCIEPQFYIFQMLNTNLILNDATNCIPINSFILNKTGNIKVSALIAFSETNAKVNYGEFNIDKYTDINGINTNIMKLDDIDYLDKEINMIKMDCEGFEKEAILSGESLIKKDKPHMYLEFNSKVGNDDLLYTLNDMGYNCYWHVYTKYNKNNFKNNSLNVYLHADEQDINPTVELLDKFYEANIVCIHKDSDITFDEKVLPGDNVVKYLLDRKMIDE